METLVGLKKLRENMNIYIEQVNQGKSFIILRKSKPLFKISPLLEEGLWEPVIDFTKIKKGGLDIDKLISRL
ncbi:hypothetical protein K8R66_01880 [bacterium]|nr:hypothetical protein [bacterium]